MDLLPAGAFIVCSWRNEPKNTYGSGRVPPSLVWPTFAHFSASIEIGGRLAPPPLSHHPACLLGTGRFQSTSSLQSKIEFIRNDQADLLEPTQAHASVGLRSVS